MAARALLYLGETSRKCIFTTVQYPNARMQMQTSWRQTRGFKRDRDAIKKLDSTLIEASQGAAPMTLRRLWKPLGFTVAFGGASVVIASICEYERLRWHWRCTSKTCDKCHRSGLILSGRTGWRGDAEKWWRSLREGQRVFAPILFANVLVFLAWRVPAFNKTMMRYFCSNPSSSATCWPMLLSTFSHYSAVHLACNMYVLHSMSNVCVPLLGREQFAALYLTSGVVASLASYAYKMAINTPSMSLGASGAILGVVALLCVQYPDTRLSIIFLPMWTFAASSALKFTVAFDTLGCIMRWKIFDHAAHLGGCLFGSFWSVWGSANLWNKREPIVRYWHSIRQPPPTSSS